ncbi:MAG: glucose-6-phosphate isomerase [Vicinamibacterales bacterium]
MSFSIDSGPIGPEVDRAFDRLAQFRFADALWRRELAVWSHDSSVQQRIANRLGWLAVLDLIRPSVDRLRGFAEGVRTGGFTDVVLLGMGGSSLAPEVMRHILGVAPGYPRFRMLDSVNPDAVRDAMTHAATSLFVYASKSGGTIEPRVLAAEARARVEAAGHTPWGSRFVAITDENTELHRLALGERFRDIFLNPGDIGGRYSALSFFGLVPAALMGADLERLLDGARAMADACRASDPRTNPGVALGALMATAADAGRDKLTLLTPPRLASFGVWVEQLVAESTGKDGKGVVPVAGETPRATWADDRVAVVVTLDREAPEADAVERVRSTGAPVAWLTMRDAHALGGEFFRWEVATAAAGWLLRINPFDEPNVEQAKSATRALLDTYVTERRQAAPEPHAMRDGVRFTLSDAAQQRLDSAPPDDFLTLLRPGDYFALLSFVSPGAADFAAACEHFRSEVATRGHATMFGYGPRYLHSTGQLHKGGPPTGLFVIVTADPVEDLPIPGFTFTFGVLEQAQALGDFASLDAVGRRAMLVQLPRPDASLFERITARLITSLAGSRPR